MKHIRRIPVNAPSDGEDLLYCLQPIISLKWINNMRECWGIMAREFPMIVPWWLILVHFVHLILHICHSIGHVLEKLHLPCMKLLHDWIHLSLLLITA
jgi:hypothetical protein